MLGMDLPGSLMLMSGGGGPIHILHLGIYPRDPIAALAPLAESGSLSLGPQLRQLHLQQVSSCASLWRCCHWPPVHGDPSISFPPAVPDSPVPAPDLREVQHLPWKAKVAWVLEWF